MRIPRQWKPSDDDEMDPNTLGDMLMEFFEGLHDELFAPWREPPELDADGYYDLGGGGRVRFMTPEESDALWKRLNGDKPRGY